MNEHYSGARPAVDPAIVEAHRDAWDQLAESGTWWDARSRAAIAARARAACAQRGSAPWLRTMPARDGLPDAAVDAIDRLVFDAASIDRAVVDGWVGGLDDGRYVELVGVVATILQLDVLARGVGIDVVPLPEPRAGEPTRERPDGLGDIGAHVPMLHPFPFANVARALSLVPDANTLFRSVMVPLYATSEFGNLAWDRPLPRPQTELVATRVAAMNECFY